MNPLQQLHERLLAKTCCPLTFESPPVLPNGWWSMVMTIDADVYMIEWASDIGFGLSRCTDETLFQNGYDESFKDIDAVETRVLELAKAYLR